ncbi:hypothetical protein [Mangrovimonas cancribranchiae]|uniref:Prenyltransferase n=1 Tax=Mangrovimonas cancribranchiae TaxID=3080055 RepID=A0AAU6P3C2_9FLAO
MQLAKNLFNFYLNSSIHVALSVFALSWVTVIEFDFSFDENVMSFVFFASITGYNFVKYFGLAKFHHRSLAKWLRVIQVFSLLCFVAMIVFFFTLKPNTWWYILGMAVVTFLYAIPFIPRKYVFDSHNNLRDIGGIKVYIIACVWAIVTVCLPLANGGYEVSFDVLITVLQRFVFVLVLMLPFEIRDLQYDSLKLATIPQKIGVKRTKILGSLGLVVFCLLELMKDHVQRDFLTSTVIISIITLLFLWFSTQKQKVYYCAFWVEAIPIFWLLLLLLF